MPIVDELVGRIGFQVTGTDQVRQALSIWERARRSLLVFINRFRGRGRFIADVFRGMRDELRDLSRAREVGRLYAAVNNVGTGFSLARTAAIGLRAAIVGVGSAATATVAIIGGMAVGIKAATSAAGALGKALLNVRGENIAAEARGTNKARTENLTAGVAGAFGIEHQLSEKIVTRMQSDMDKLMRGVQAGEQSDIEKAKKLGLLDYLKRGDADSSVAVLKALGTLQEKRQAYADKPGLPSRLRELRQYENELGTNDAYRFLFAAMEKRLAEAAAKGERFGQTDLLNAVEEAVIRNFTESQAARNVQDAKNVEAATKMQQAADKVRRANSEILNRLMGLIARNVSGTAETMADNYQRNATAVSQFLDDPKEGVKSILQGILTTLQSSFSLLQTLENQKPVIKPENFGNDQRQVSITINQQVTGDTAPQAAAGAVNSALGKSTNVPTINFGVP